MAIAEGIDVRGPSRKAGKQYASKALGCGRATGLERFQRLAFEILEQRKHDRWLGIDVEAFDGEPGDAVEAVEPDARDLAEDL